MLNASKFLFHNFHHLTSPVKRVTDIFFSMGCRGTKTPASKNSIMFKQFGETIRLVMVGAIIAILMVNDLLFLLGSI